MATLKYKFSKFTYLENDIALKYETEMEYDLVSGDANPLVLFSSFTPEKVISCPSELIFQTGRPPRPPRPVNTPYRDRRY